MNEGEVEGVRLTLKEIVDIVVEFIEVAIHTILFVREVYPNALFERCRKYDIPVQKSRSPLVSNYISTIVSSMHPWLEKGELEKVVIAILNKDKQLIERFVFEIEGICSPDAKRIIDLQKLEDHFRAVLLKINLSDSMIMSDYKEHPTFTIVIHTKTHQPSSSWVSINTTEERLSFPSFSIFPIKGLDCPFLRMQLYVEIPS